MLDDLALIHETDEARKQRHCSESLSLAMLLNRELR